MNLSRAQFWSFPGFVVAITVPGKTPIIPLRVISIRLIMPLFGGGFKKYLDKCLGIPQTELVQDGRPWMICFESGWLQSDPASPLKSDIVKISFKTRTGDTIETEVVTVADLFHAAHLCWASRQPSSPGEADEPCSPKTEFTCTNCNQPITDEREQRCPWCIAPMCRSCWNAAGQCLSCEVEHCSPHPKFQGHPSARTRTMAHKAIVPRSTGLVRGLKGSGRPPSTQ